MRVVAWIVILLTVFVVAYNVVRARGSVEMFVALNAFNPLLLVLLPAAGIGAMILVRR
jgi:hypothetical protein